jgi:hypothetical protein
MPEVSYLTTIRLAFSLSRQKSCLGKKFSTPGEKLSGSLVSCVDLGWLKKPHSGTNKLPCPCEEEIRQMARTRGGGVKN